VPFAVTMPETSRLEPVKAKYSLPDKYFYFPSQVWRHKNHAVLIDAVQTLLSEGFDTATVVMSGQKMDPRHPQWFEDLFRRISNRGLEKRLIFLDVIPYPDVLALMQHSVAVLNPSLSEGWSTTVEEAKALGVRLILSDIPIHREQAPPGTRFFSPHAPVELAASMRATADEKFERPRRAILETANKLSLREYALRFEGVCRAAARNCIP
jgi:glycosyltransferase involved in cell wall biosynthesis